MAKILLEVVAGSVDEALAAADAGADRIELCSALPVGGLTPSLGLASEVVQSVSIPVVVMLRGREGGFVISDAEFRTMLADMAALRDVGVRGFVFAILKPNGSLDSARCRELVTAAGEAETVFHRAFDGMSERSAVLESLTELGFARLLTSGGAPTAIEGKGAVADLMTQSAGRIQILPGGGVRPTNVVELIRDTGVSQVHFSARRFGAAGYDGFPDPILDADLVAQMRTATEAV